MKMKQLALLLAILLPLLSYSQHLQRQKDTIGYFTFTEEINDNLHQSSLPVTVDKLGYLYIPLSARAMDIQADLVAGEVKANFLKLFEEFEFIDRNRKAAGKSNLVPLVTTIQCPAIGFRVNGRQYNALKSELSFTYTLELKELPGSKGNLVVSVSNIKDFFYTEMVIDNYYLYMTTENVMDLKKVIEGLE